VLLNDVEVVEKPLAGRPDVRLRGGGRGQALVRGGENALRALQSREQGCASPSLARNEGLGARLDACPLGQMFGSEQLAANRASERLVSVVDDGRKEPGRERAWKGQRWNGLDRE
jgi:hypothetical protein